MHSHNAFTLLLSYPIKVSCNQWEWFESILCMVWWCVTYKIDGIKGSCDLAQSDFFWRAKWLNIGQTEVDPVQPCAMESKNMYSGGILGQYTGWGELGL